MIKKALVFIHQMHEGPDLFRDILALNGFEVAVVFTPTTDISEYDPLAPDLAIVMGGPMGVYEAEKYPFLKKEISFLKTRLAAEKPTFGICLGSQLMAAALGQTVFKGGNGKEIGWNPLILTEAGQNSPLKHIDGSKTSMLHWHGDTYELPPGATLLASSSVYKNQAYSYGKFAMATQFHPEVTPYHIAEWLDEAGDEVGESVLTKGAGAMRKETKQRITTMNLQSTKFFTEWLQNVGLI